MAGLKVGLSQADRIAVFRLAENLNYQAWKGANVFYAQKIQQQRNYKPTTWRLIQYKHNYQFGEF